MCGRYRLTTTGSSLHQLFRAELGHDHLAWRPRFNVAPTDLMPVVRAVAGDAGARPQLHISRLQWGLVPSWSKDQTSAARMINARSESVFEKAAFKDCLRRRRCLVLADGFYEWQTLPGTSTKPKKQPMLFSFDDDRPFAMAGLWASWQGPPGVIHTFTILTAPANDLVRPVHDRMPVIVDAADHDAWLDPHNEHVDVARLAQPRSMEHFKMRAVSAKVGNVKNDDESVLIADELVTSTRSGAHEGMACAAPLALKRKP